MCMIAAMRPESMLRRSPAASVAMSSVPVRSSAFSAAACRKAWGRAVSCGIGSGSGMRKGGFCISATASASFGPAGEGIQIAKNPPTTPPARIRGRSMWPVPSPSSHRRGPSAPAATTRWMKSLWPSNTAIMPGLLRCNAQTMHRDRGLGNAPARAACQRRESA